MRIVVTGAAGLVGRGVVAGLGAKHEVVPLVHSALDITDGAAVARTMRDLRPDLIVNCAVLGVDACERDPSAAEAINVAGPAALAKAAEIAGAGIVHFSSNYVFDGRREMFYAIDDSPAPVNIYGKTKLAGELAVARLCPGAYIIRTSWVFGRGKASFVSTVDRQLRAGERVRAIDDVWASTTYVVDLVERLAEIVDRREFGTHHVVNDGVCSHDSFAREAARLVGADERLIESISVQEKREAPRPRYTPLLALPPLRHWRAALASYIESVEV